MKKVQFRYSPAMWPNSRLPLPRIAVPGSVTLDDSGWLLTALSGLDIRSAPEELHLREMRDADPGSADDIVNLVGTVGSLLNPVRPWVGVTSPGTIPGIAEANYRMAVENIGAQLGYDSPSWDSRPAGATHLSEEAMRLVFSRRLVDHVDAAMSEESTAEGWQEIGAFDDLDSPILRGSPGDRELLDESPETLAWYFFSEMLNEGLADVSPRIIPPSLDSWPDMGDVLPGYTCACVLIFNDLIDLIPYRRCADETCGRIFRHQIGRSSGGFKRSEGVAFCSPQHARSQSQRERRRRDRSERARVEES